ncbi:hypothetical protein TanjilG_16139 [Lupinus angustifolius]|uniref:EF-hand domain-containing protein n=1 Tax=Lupinus angustifolius TaxID=3871 RepID=A0A1J7IMM9_LUPAN|nr:hypothetical protein TanjilG_16139 [Lupinus angustifolius]
MEPLLRGENSGRRDRPRGLHRRSDALTYGSNYEKAAALVDLAEDGVGLPEQILDSSSFQSYAKFYFIFTKFDLIWSLSYFALIVLNFLEVFCLLVLVADMLVYALYSSPLAFDSLPFRIAPYIRVVLFVLNVRTLPNISREEFELIFDELDDTHDVKINKDEFADICNAIALKFQKEDCLSYFEYLAFYHSPTSKKLKAFVKSPMFGYLVSFILLLNLGAVIVETTLDIQNSSAQKVWQVVEFVFGWIYVIEMALKVYSFGFENYWRDGQNRFDFIITLIIGN